MDRRYLTVVAPLPDHILQVDFVSGARLLLDMKPYLDKIRFLPLADPKVWNSAVTNGISFYMVCYESDTAAAARFTDVPFDAYYRSAVGWA